MTSMNTLPAHGRIACDTCFAGCGGVEFDATRREEGDWRITANPLAWGSSTPEIVVLGFSKGPNQAGVLASAAHDAIAYRGGRHMVGKFLRHVGLLPGVADADLGSAVSSLIADRNGRFHFGSLVRCTVERREKGHWTGTGGGMLDRFVETPFGRQVARACTRSFLSQLPPRTKLVVMFGLGNKLNYVEACMALFSDCLGGTWRKLNDVAYSNGRITVVHVEHFKSQGALPAQWLGERDHLRADWGRQAQEAVSVAFPKT